MVLLPITLAALWMQLYWSLVPTWRDGEYYGYGWFVPPLAFAFAWRRWQMWKENFPATKIPSLGKAAWPWGLALLLTVLFILPLRMIGEADPNWRPPLILHAALVCILTHGLLWQMKGRGLSISILPVTIFALTAVPPPWQIEQGMVRKLTDTVIFFTHEVFLLLGRPVEVMGERLTLGNEVVEVTEGCSGIRSLQSLGMAALFFGELLFLTWGRRILLLVAAGVCAVTINTARAWLLAEIQFSKGQAAAAAAHDGIGHLAFAASAALLFGAAWLMQRRSSRRVTVVRRVLTSAG